MNRGVDERAKNSSILGGTVLMFFPIDLKVCNYAKRHPRIERVKGLGEKRAKENLRIWDAREQVSMRILYASRVFSYKL